MPQSDGDDTLEFMISPNPGEPLKPLAKIASGGELSRMMLAIKSLEAARGGVGTMVFDEIDTGISGRMAQVVAEKMADDRRASAGAVRDASAADRRHGGPSAAGGEASGGGPNPHHGADAGPCRPRRRSWRA